MSKPAAPALPETPETARIASERAAAAWWERTRAADAGEPAPTPESLAAQAARDLAERTRILREAKTEAAPAPMTTDDGLRHLVCTRALWLELIGDDVWDAWAIPGSDDVVLAITPFGNSGTPQIRVRCSREEAEDARAEAWHLVGLAH